METRRPRCQEYHRQSAQTLLAFVLPFSSLLRDLSGPPPSLQGFLPSGKHSEGPLKNAPYLLFTHTKTPVFLRASGLVLAPPMDSQTHVRSPPPLPRFPSPSSSPYLVHMEGGPGHTLMTPSDWLPEERSLFRLASAWHGCDSAGGTSRYGMDCDLEIVVGGFDDDNRETRSSSIDLFTTVSPSSSPLPDTTCKNFKMTKASFERPKTPTPSHKPRSELQEVERDTGRGRAWMLTGNEAKLLGIAGIGFFLDAYDLFIINPVATMLQYRLYNGEHLPANLEGFVKAGANIGSVIGQFLFGELSSCPPSHIGLLFSFFIPVSLSLHLASFSYGFSSIRYYQTLSTTPPFIHSVPLAIVSLYPCPVSFRLSPSFFALLLLFSSPGAHFPLSTTLFASPHPPTSITLPFLSSFCFALGLLLPFAFLFLHPVFATHVNHALLSISTRYLADALGRQRVYGKELMLIIFATIMTLTTPTGQLSPDASLIYLGVWRIILGIGVGGDYPMSASVTSDRANIRKRGTMLTYIFSMQGWGSLMGSLIVIILLAIYKNVIDGEGKISKVDGVWRIAVGLSLVPAFGTLYQRLTLGEATRYEESKKLGSTSTSAGVASSSANDSEDEIIKLKELQRKQEAKDSGAQVDVESRPSSPTSEEDRNRDKKTDVDEVKKPAHFKDFLEHFGRWENAKLLFATSMSWFLLDIAFYGINLNQNVVLQQIGFDGSSGSPWHRLFRVSTGNIIITVLGFVPGYYATLFTIEILGRKWIQIQGFLLSALFLGILAGKFHTLSTVQFIVCFAFLQFFFNFGANTTTYCYPAEVFPTRYKAFAHGISAASGKAGAIISALAFNQLSKKIGTPACLWIFMGCCLAGAAVSLLLPEVRGRDADLILAQQIEERKREGRR
ncbi:hypothetical protein NMY22_g5555 [Coprinellus aureogranulatus]|nr:hypothetical protein NMY22_g5555 [Coprinellus aureogranulatus]